MTDINRENKLNAGPNNHTQFGQLAYMNMIYASLINADNIPEDYVLTVLPDGTVDWMPSTAVGGGGAVDSVFGRTGVVVAEKGDYEASQVTLPTLGPQPHDNAETLGALYRSTGWRSGGGIVDVGGGNVDIAAGTGMIRATDDSLAPLIPFSWPALSGVAVPAETPLVFVGVEYNGGTARAYVTTAPFDFQTNFPLGRVVNTEGAVHVLELPQMVGDHASLTMQRLHQTEPFAIKVSENSTGFIIGEKAGRFITVTEGTVWDCLLEFTHPPFDSSTAHTFDSYYRASPSGFTKIAAQSVWDNVNYDDNSGTLQPVQTNQFANLWFYIDLNRNIKCIYGRAKYTSLSLALEEPLPPTLPLLVEQLYVPLGLLTFKRDDATASKIQSAFTRVFTSTGVANHSALNGVGINTHDQIDQHIGNAVSSIEEAKVFAYHMSVLVGQ